MWVKPEDLVDGNGRAFGYNTESDGNSGAGFGIFGGRFEWLYKFGGAGKTPVHRSDAAFPSGWHHVVFLADGVGLVRIFVDGAEVLSTFDPKSGTGADGTEWFADIAQVTTFEHQIFIGANKDNGNPLTNGWRGLIDEVRLYDRALTLAEIQALCDVPSVCGP